MLPTIQQIPLTAPDLLQIRRALLSLTVLNIVIYVALLIPLALFSSNTWPVLLVWFKVEFIDNF